MKARNCTRTYVNVPFPDLAKLTFRLEFLATAVLRARGRLRTLVLDRPVGVGLACDRPVGSVADVGLGTTHVDRQTAVCRRR